MYIKRHIENIIIESSKSYPVIMVTGPRQVGKSTLLNNLKEENRKYVTLDDSNALRLATEDPKLFFDFYGHKLLIDEFQRCPSILLEMKKIIDEVDLKGENNAGMFWLTGSQKFKMMKDVADSLAGRVANFELLGLSNAEIENKDIFYSLDLLSLKGKNNAKKNIHKIYQNIFLGGMPKLIVNNLDHDTYYRNYIDTYLERDVRGLENVGKINDFYRFLCLLAGRTSQELNYNEIASNIGVSSVIIKSWISILVKSGIIYLLEPYYSNLSKRIIKRPKIYFLDTALAVYLTRWPNSETLENSMMDGAILETFVVSEIIKNCYNLGKNPNIFFYRDIDKKEVDLIVFQDNKVFLIEIKKSKIPKNADKNFKVLNKFDLEIDNKYIFCLTDDLIPYSKDVYLVPINLL